MKLFAIAIALALAACSQPAPEGLVAIAGPDLTVATGARVALDGSLSHGRPGAVLSFHWKMTQRPAQSAALLDDERAAETAFVADVPGLYTLFLEVSDGTSTSPAAQLLVNAAPFVPIPVASAPASVLVGDRVVLDGSATIGDGLMYKWSILQGPTTDTVAIDDATAATASFVPQLPGDYIVELKVSAAFGASGTTQVTVEADINLPPAVGVTGGGTVTTGQPVTLSATVLDPEERNLVLGWRLANRPFTSSATLVSTSPTEVSFTPDHDGEYDVVFTVDDGWNQVPTTIAVKALHGMRVLDYDVVAADRSLALGRLILASRQPKALHLLDVASGDDRMVTLSSAPTSLSVTPDGHTAVVGHDGRISVVDLDGARLVSATDVLVPVGPIAAAGDGYAYYARSGGVDAPIATLRIADGAVGSIGDSQVQVQSLTLQGAALFVGTYQVYTVAGGILGDVRFNPTADRMWPSRDGQIIVGLSGAIYDPDLNGIGVLDGGPFQWADAVSARGPIWTLEGQAVRFYPDTSGSPSDEIALPAFGGSPVVSPLWIFASADGSRADAVVQAAADPPYVPEAGPFAVITVVP